jgi:hypothetical protein
VGPWIRKPKLPGNAASRTRQGGFEMAMRKMGLNDMMPGLRMDIVHDFQRLAGSWGDSCLIS